MRYHIDTLTRMTRMAMGRNARSHPAIACHDDAAVSLDRRIAAAIPAAALEAVMLAPVTMLTDIAVDFADSDICRHDRQDDINNDDPGWHSGHILLPDDFARLVCFRMDDWRRAVHSATDIAETPLQSSRNAAVRGVPERPVCYLRASPEGLQLHFHSCRSPDTPIAEATYAPIPAIDTDGTIDIPRGCLAAVIDRLAAI